MGKVIFVREARTEEELTKLKGPPTSILMGRNIQRREPPADEDQSAENSDQDQSGD